MASMKAMCAVRGSPGSKRKRSASDQRPNGTPRRAGIGRYATWWIFMRLVDNPAPTGTPMVMTT